MKRLFKSICKALPIAVICVGICLSALVEAGFLRLEDISAAFDFPAYRTSQVTEEDGGVSMPAEAENFSVTFIDVGQGDSVLIRCSGKSMLIDGGEEDSGAAEYLAAAGIKRLDMIIATHPHSDHIGGLPEIITGFGADRIIVPRLTEEMTPSTKVYENFLTAVKDSGGKLTAAKAGAEYELGEAKVTILYPLPETSSDDLNDWSVCARVDYGDISWLFTGDLSSPGEKALLQSGADIDVTAYKAGHHGSSTASTEKFLERVTPSLCVISCGAGNSYGHPSGEALERFSLYTDHVLRTDISGDITVYSDGKKLYVKRKK